jgi:hypothetical protein
VSDEYNTIDGLLLLLSERKPNGCYYDQRYHAALTALVAERDALKQRVAELEALSKPVYISHGQRVESIDLRGRLVCAALTRLCADPRYDFPEEAAIAIADRALAAMRKGEA